MNGEQTRALRASYCIDVCWLSGERKRERGRRATRIGAGCQARDTVRARARSIKYYSDCQKLRLSPNLTTHTHKPHLGHHDTYDSCLPEIENVIVTRFRPSFKCSNVPTWCYSLVFSPTLSSSVKHNLFSFECVLLRMCSLESVFS